MALSKKSSKYMKKVLTNILKICYNNIVDIGVQFSF